MTKPACQVNFDSRSKFGETGPNGCLDSDCDVVNFLARHGVYFRRMLSPVRRNSLFC